MTFHFKKIIFFLGFSFFLMVSLPIEAVNYYVVVTGNDSNPGTETQPWRTISKAAATLSSGDSVYIRGGIYQERVTFAGSGTATAPIKILAYPGETPIIDGNNYTIATNWGALLYLSGDYV